MDKIVVTALLMTAGIISAVLVFNAVYPAVTQSGQVMTGMERRIDEQMQSQIKIIHAAVSGNNVQIWVKNIGSLRIAPPESSDLFFGPQGNFSRIPYMTGGSNPQWIYTLENDTDWKPTATLRITITFDSAPPAGTYYIKLVLPNGVGDEYFASW